MGDRMTEDRLQVIREGMWRILNSEGETHSVGAEPAQNEVPEYEQPRIKDKAVSLSSSKHSSAPGILEEWRRVSIPEWRRILKDAELAGDTPRARYAQWMLSDVLKAGTSEDDSEL